MLFLQESSLTSRMNFTHLNARRLSEDSYSLFPRPPPPRGAEGFEHLLEPHALARTRRGLQARTRATRPRKNA